MEEEKKVTQAEFIKMHMDFVKGKYEHTAKVLEENQKKKKDLKNWKLLNYLWIFVNELLKLFIEFCKCLIGLFINFFQSFIKMFFKL